ncbi:aspartate/glutamate racemase family protein, partial [Providencia rettgeri]
IMQSIILYKSGDLAKARELLYPYISQLKSRGIDKFVMGCTEIPLILEELSKNNPEDFIDATEALIKEAINWYTIDEKREVDEEKTNKLIEFH